MSIYIIDPDTNLEEQLFHPQQQEWTDHFAWNNDATEIVGLTATGRATIQTLKMNRDQLIRVRRMWASLGEHPPTTSD